MKVLLISTSDRKGGAAIACLRLFNALKKNGTDVKMLVRDKLTNTEGVYTVNTNIFKKAINKMAFLAERLEIFFAMRFRRKNLFRVSTGRFGVFNLQSHPLVQDPISICLSQEYSMPVFKSTNLYYSFPGFIVTTVYSFSH